jgi:hypothetical protein
MDRVINLSLLREPYNWIIVILMLAIAVYGIALLQPTLTGLQTSTMQVI